MIQLMLNDAASGNNIFHFHALHSIQSVKESLRGATEEMATSLDLETQNLVINEGI